MRQFAFKNLTVNVAHGGAQLCLQTQPTCAVACSAIAIGVSRIGCRINASVVQCDPASFITNTILTTGGTCGVNYSTSVPTDWLTHQIATAVDPHEIDVLRSQLDVATKLLDEQATQVRSSHSPQTLEEAELVESHLTEALDEVRTIRANLERG